MREIRLTVAIIKSFKGWRPRRDIVSQVASRPYDVLNSAEARVEAEGNPHSFLHVVKPEIDLPEDQNPYDAKVYETGRLNFEKMVAEGFVTEELRLKAMKEHQYWIETEAEQMVMKLKEVRGIL